MDWWNYYTGDPVALVLAVVSLVLGITSVILALRGRP